MFSKVLKSALNRPKIGPPHAVWNFHTLVWLSGLYISGHLVHICKSEFHISVWNFHTPVWFLCMLEPGRHTTVWILWKPVFSALISVLLRHRAYQLLITTFFIEATPSGTRWVVDRVFSSFRLFCRSFFTITRVRLYEYDCLRALPNKNSFGTMEVGTHPQV